MAYIKKRNLDICTYILTYFSSTKTVQQNEIKFKRKCYFIIQTIC